MLTEKFTFKIDLSKVDQSRIFAGTNGAQYLDFEAVPTTASKYGDSHFIVQRQTKEERLARAERLPICGNVKPPYQAAGTTHTSTPQSGTRQPSRTPPPARSGPKEGPGGSVDTSGIDPNDPPPF